MFRSILMNCVLPITHYLFREVYNDPGLREYMRTRVAPVAADAARSACGVPPRSQAPRWPERSAQRTHDED